MDIEIFRTFLEVNRTRHFAAAAVNLFVTQAAVSARIRQLETRLGAPVFTRERNNIQLTPAGHRLLPYAESIVATWNRARQQVGVEHEQTESLSVGGLPSLWDILLQDWIARLYAAHEHLRVTAEVVSGGTLLPRVRESYLDVGFIYEPIVVRDLVTVEVAVLELAFVATRPELKLDEALACGYVYVDWGTSFAIQHARLMPGEANPVFRVDSARVAYEFIRSSGGSAFLPMQLIAPDLEAKRLFRVQGTPIMERSVHAVYGANSDRIPLIEEAIAAIG